jgi:hypothetical protein
MVASIRLPIESIGFRIDLGIALSRNLSHVSKNFLRFHHRVGKRYA